MRIKVFSIGAMLMLSMFCQPVLAADSMSVQGFSDVSLSNPHYAAIMDLKARGIISGYPDGTFKPDQVVNRAEALKLILGAAKIAVPTDAAMGLAGFSDVDGSQWYGPYLRAALSEGIVSGYPDGTFRPAQTVNLVENLKMLINAEKIDLSNISSTAAAYNDSEANAWYSNFLEFAKEKNLIVADAKNNIYPDQGMTRGTLAELLYRLLFVQDRNLDTFPQGEIITSDANEPIAFSTTAADVTVFKSTSLQLNEYNAEELAAAADECGTQYDANHFKDLMTHMGGVVTTYTFVENKQAQENHFSVEVMPNSFGYADLAAFQKDFNVCAAGATYPTLVNSKWLVSEGSCGGAMDDSGLPDGCSDIEQAIGSSIVLK